MNCPLLQFFHASGMGQYLFQPPHNPDQSGICNEQKCERKEPFEKDPESALVHLLVGLIMVQLGKFPTDCPEKDTESNK